MCLAIPALIKTISGYQAEVDIEGVSREVSLQLTPEAKVGDLVLIHAGFAISLVDEEEAKKTWQLIAEISEFDDTPNKISG